MALFDNSPAIDQGNAFGAATDQRGLLRTRDFPAIPNASGGDGSDIGAFESGASVPVLSVVSRKTHGTSGAFDLPIPITGAVGVECRSGGAGMNHQLIVTFPSAVSVGGLSLVSRDNQASGNYTVSDNILTLNLSGVGNAQILQITLNNVTTSSTQGTVSISLGVLLGDSNSDRAVNSGDAQQTRNRSGQTTDGTNFRSDFNTDGTINSGDAFIVRSRSGQSIP